MQLILATHVDDLIWACKSSAEYIIAKIKNLLILGTGDVQISRYRGKEVTQDLGTFSINIACIATSEKLSEFKLRLWDVLRHFQQRLHPRRRNG